MFVEIELSLVDDRKQDRASAFARWRWFLGQLRRYYKGLEALPEEWTKEAGSISQHSRDEDDWLIAAEYNYNWWSQTMRWDLADWIVEAVFNEDDYGTYHAFYLRDKDYKTQAELLVRAFKGAKLTLGYAQVANQSEWTEAAKNLDADI